MTLTCALLRNVRSLVVEASQGGWPICRAMELAQQRLAEHAPVSPADAEKCRYYYVQN